MYYLNARYYDPKTGRFISADDAAYLDPQSVNGLNLYAYCGNNPVMNVDPSGRFGVGSMVAIGLISFIVGGGVKLISNAIEGKTGSELWRGVAGAAFGSLANAFTTIGTAAFGPAGLALSAFVGSTVQTAVDIIELAIRGEEIGLDVLIDSAINLSSTLIGNFVSAGMVPINRGWFQPQHFLSVFTKSYGQRIIIQNLISGFLSFTANTVVAFIKAIIEYYEREDSRGQD